MSLLVWEQQGEGAAGQHHDRGGGFGGVESERAAGDKPHAVVQSLYTCVGEVEADGGEDAVAVRADGAGEADEPGDAAALRPGAPAVQQRGDVAVAQVGIEDAAQGFFELVGAPGRPASAFERQQRVVLAV